MHTNEQILSFLRALSANNYREWFQAHKEEYDRLRQAFTDEVQQLINRIALFDPEVAGLEAKNCLYRIYRDIRFSPDKTPYKNHFAAYIASGGRGSLRGGYYLHIEPERCMLSGGVWCPAPPLLKQLRRDIYDHIEEFTEILENPAFKQHFPGLEGESLKRMPAGYPADCPYGDILRHKDFCVVTQQPEAFFSSPDWLEQTAAIFELLQPFNRFLNYTVDDYLGDV